MADKRRPKRRNPKAERLTFVCELEYCPKCGKQLSSEGSAAHSHKTVQTLDGSFYVVAYSRLCQNADCSEYGEGHSPRGDQHVRAFRERDS